MNLFNFIKWEKPDLKTVARGLNITALFLASYEMLTNPEASHPELGLDILTHTVTYMALSDESASIVNRYLAFVLNHVREGAIYAGITSDCSTLPTATNLFDALLHATNLFTLLKTASHRDPAPTPAIGPS